ncbi:MAG TPA: hypothetical protein VD772_11865, partial [Anseongella sp.]|nr:hypothetical protein [Anseongella sp.]
RPDTLTLKGIYTYGEEISRFMECGNDSTSYWLSDPDSLLAPKAKEFEFFAQAWNSVYTELEAVKLPRSQEGFAAEYDSLLEVVDVLAVEAKSFRTECFPYDFWCLGNEPFWSVEISGSENLVRLTDLGTESAYYYQYAEPSVEGDVYTYAIPAEAKQPPVKILIKKEECSDGMSERRYDYSVRVEAGDRTLNGCAIAGKAVEP